MPDEVTSRKVSVKNICEDILGGNYTTEDNSCQFLEQPEMFDRSISDSPKYTVYYALQIFVGTALSFFGVFFGITLVPPWWYLNLIIFIFSIVFFLYADWYRENALLESFKRLGVMTLIYIVVSILIATTIEFGTIFNAKYWIPITFLTTDPVIATIIALLAASLLNVFLLPKAEIIQILK